MNRVVDSRGSLRRVRRWKPRTRSLTESTGRRLNGWCGEWELTKFCSEGVYKRLWRRWCRGSPSLKERQHPIGSSRSLRREGGSFERCVLRVYEYEVKTDSLGRDARYVVNEVTGCWIFLGFIDGDGYGRVGSTVAHRVYYEQYRGPIPDGLVLDHLCVRRNCVNPDHLEPVTDTENQNRTMKYRAKWVDVYTHCKRGHEFTPENTRVAWKTRANGKTYQIRNCRECERIRNAGYRGAAPPLTIEPPGGLVPARNRPIPRDLRPSKEMRHGYLECGCA